MANDSRLFQIVEKDLAANFETATASSSAANRGPDFVVDRRRDTYWKATGTSSEWLKVQLGTGGINIFNAICLGRTNFADWTGTVTIEGSADDVAWTTIVSDFDFDTWRSAAIRPGGGDPFNPWAGEEGDIGIFFGSGNESWKWVRINFSSVAAAPEVGIFTVGRAFDYLNPAFGEYQETLFWPFEEASLDDGGILREGTGRPRWRFHIGWRALFKGTGGGDEGVVDYYGSVMNTMGQSRPFWYIPRDDAVASNDDRGGRAYYVWSENPYVGREIASNRFDIDIQLREV